jgi:hypothetical protein
VFQSNSIVSCQPDPHLAHDRHHNLAIGFDEVGQRAVVTVCSAIPMYVDELHRDAGAVSIALNCALVAKAARLHD